MGTEKRSPNGEGGVADVTDRRDHAGATRCGDPAAVAHELRTPLNVAKGRLAMVRKSCDCGSDHLDAVDAALEQMVGLVDELLGGVPAGDVVTRGERVDVEEVVWWCWEGVADGDARLTVEGDLGTVVAHRDRFSGLVANVLRNAVEHGSTSSRPGADDAVEHGSTNPRSQAREDSGEQGDQGVVIRVGRLPDGFYVADDGSGIAPERRERAFERGYSDADGGTGLGLHLVRQAATSHGWTVDLTESASGGVRIEIRGVEFT